VPETRREVSSFGLGFVGEEAALGCGEGRGMELLARLCRGGFSRRQRAGIQGHRGLGPVPGRWIFSVYSISSMGAGVYCGSCQSLLAMELWRPVVGGDRLPAMVSGDGF